MLQLLLYSDILLIAGYLFETLGMLTAFNSTKKNQKDNLDLLYFLS